MASQGHIQLIVVCRELYVHLGVLTKLAAYNTSEGRPKHIIQMDHSYIPRVQWLPSIL